MATQTIKKTKYRQKKVKGKVSANKEYIKCNICGGRGFLENWHKGK